MRRSTFFVLGGLIAALLLAGVVSNFASPRPDGLDSVAREGCTFDAHDNITGGTCMARSAEKSQTKDSPLADYGIKGVANRYLSTGLSGVAGVLLTFGIGAGLLWLARRFPAGKAPVPSGQDTKP